MTGKKKSSIIDAILMKDGRKIDELNRSEIIQVLVNHALPGHDDENVDGATLPAAAGRAAAFLVERNQTLAKSRADGVKTNEARANEFDQQLRGYVAGQKPGMKAITIRDLVWQLIEMDTA